MIRKLLALGVIAFSLAGCGNQDLGLGSYTFDHCHIQMGGDSIENSKHYKVVSWKDDGDGSGWELKIEIPGGDTMSLSISSECVVCFGGNYCPVCGKQI